MRGNVRARFRVRSFFFNDTATTEIYTLSLHDALPISAGGHRPSRRLRHGRRRPGLAALAPATPGGEGGDHPAQDRKSTRLNSSHDQISYAVFCLKEKTRRSED